MVTGSRLISGHLQFFLHPDFHNIHRVSEKTTHFYICENLVYIVQFCHLLAEIYPRGFQQTHVHSTLHLKLHMFVLYFCTSNNFTSYNTASKYT